GGRACIWFGRRRTAAAPLWRDLNGSGRLAWPAAIAPWPGILKTCSWRVARIRWRHGRRLRARIADRGIRGGGSRLAILAHGRGEQKVPLRPLGGRRRSAGRGRL